MINNDGIYGTKGTIEKINWNDFTFIITMFVLGNNRISYLDLKGKLKELFIYSDKSLINI